MGSWISIRSDSIDISGLQIPPLMHHGQHEYPLLPDLVDDPVGVEG